MQNCLTCSEELKIEKLSCTSCDITYQGEFRLHRMARLPKEHRRLAEQLLFCGGNLKELAIKMELSYPTLRKYVDEMIVELTKLQQADQAEIENILARIESNDISSGKGMRLIQEINGEY